MRAQELLKEGRLEESVAALEAEIRKAPADAKLRTFLFQLMAVMGKWERALTQLDVSAQLDAKGMLMAQVCRQAIACEMLRQEVFAGRRSPLILGEPEPWVGMVIQAAMLDGQGKADAAAQLRDQAFELAPAVEARFELAGPEGAAPQHVSSAWVADADSRLGPMLEAVVEGKYYWIPWSRVAQVTFERPTDLRDVVWLPVNFVWTTGAPAVGLMFTRYPGSEHSSDAGVRLARKTVFDDAGVPMGQRVLAGDGGEYDLLSLRSVTVGSTEVVQQALAKAAAERMKGAMEAGGMAQGMLSSMGKAPGSEGGGHG